MHIMNDSKASHIHDNTRDQSFHNFISKGTVLSKSKGKVLINS